MVEFDSLPHNSRLLILATLELEIASEDCRNIFDLARKRHQNIHDVWRDVCKKTALPRCNVPPQVMGTDFTGGANTSVFVFSDKPANASVFGDAPAPAKVASPATPIATPATPTQAHPAATTVAPVVHARPTATVTPATHARPAASGGHRSQSRNVMLAVGLAVILVLGIGLAAIVIPRSTENPYATTVTRSNDTARAPASKPSVDPNSM